MNALDRWRAVMAIRGITGPEKAVLSCLAFHAGDGNLETWPALQTIADETGFGSTAVRAAIRSLTERGLLDVIEQSSGRHSNRYRLHLDEPLAMRTVRHANRSSRELQPLVSRASTPRQATPNKERTTKEQRPPTAEPSLWDVWAGMAGESKRSMLGKLIAEYGEDAVAEGVALTSTKRPADPPAYLRGLLAKRHKRVNGDQAWVSPV